MASVRDPKLLLEAVRRIDGGMIWEKTGEGQKFWLEVSARLSKLAEQGYPDEKSPVKIVPAEEAEAKTQIEKVEARVKAYRKERDQPKVPQPEEAAKIATRS